MLIPFHCWFWLILPSFSSSARAKLASACYIIQGCPQACISPLTLQCSCVIGVCHHPCLGQGVKHPICFQRCTIWHYLLYCLSLFSSSSEALYKNLSLFIIEVRRLYTNRLDIQRNVSSSQSAEVPRGTGSSGTNGRNRRATGFPAGKPQVLRTLGHGAYSCPSTPHCSPSSQSAESPGGTGSTWTDERKNQHCTYNYPKPRQVDGSVRIHSTT